MNVRIVPFLLSSTMAAGMVVGFLVEPNKKFIGNLIQPAQAGEVGCPAVGRGVGRNQAEAKQKAIAAATRNLPPRAVKTSQTVVAAGVEGKWQATATIECYIPGWSGWSGWLDWLSPLF